MPRRGLFRLICLALMPVSAFAAIEENAPSELDHYDTVFLSPSKNETGSIMNKYQLACQMRASLQANFQAGLFRVDPKLNSSAARTWSFRLGRNSGPLGSRCHLITR